MRKSKKCDVPTMSVGRKQRHSMCDEKYFKGLCRSFGIDKSIAWLTHIAGMRVARINEKEIIKLKYYK